MNTLKFKSVAVKIDTYEKLKQLAEATNRSVGMQITELVLKESKKQQRRKSA
jgi:hypothetical protein|tara:strand:+ start:85 stop:240 length:156 start_codon:yes stop_codon:yes gene_type:complete